MSNEIKKFRYKIIVIGDALVGKNSIVRRFTNAKFQTDYKLTLGINILSKDVKINEGSIINLSIWNPTERLLGIPPTFYRNAMGVLLVFDITNLESLDNLNIWMREVSKFLGPVQKLLVGNKIDLNEHRKVTRENALDFADKLNIPYIETSAKTGENIDDCFIKMTKLIKNNVIQQE